MSFCSLRSTELVYRKPKLFDFEIYFIGAFTLGLDCR